MSTVNQLGILQLEKKLARVVSIEPVSLILANGRRVELAPSCARNVAGRLVISSKRFARISYIHAQSWAAR